MDGLVTMKQRIAIVCRDISGVTGTTTTILEHARRLVDAGWEVVVFGERLDEERITSTGARPRKLARWRFGSYFKRRLFDWLVTRALRSEGPFDLVHGHGDNLQQDVLSLHNCVHAAHEAVQGRPLPQRAGVGRIHAQILEQKHFHTLIANSELMRREVLARYKLNPERVVTIYPGYDPARFNSEGRDAGQAVRDSLGVQAGETLVGLITSGDFTKRGVQGFLGALGSLSEDVRRKMRVLIIGQETRLNTYRQLAEQTGLGDRIRFLGPDPDVARYYHALDLYVHPALYEEFGQSVQEAMACGVAVLTSERTGAAELLAPVAPECVLSKPSQSLLAEGIERFVCDPALRTRAALAGQAAVADNTWDANYQRTYKVFTDLLTERNR
jgi:UDP-glucose:(heptosyl)LPS alpha-1,3-glucosyltransferase